jgi:hypothetical protein
MEDMRTRLENLRKEAAECSLIRDFSTDPVKRQLFTRLADHLSDLATEIEAVIKASLSKEESA